MPNPHDSTMGVSELFRHPRFQNWCERTFSPSSIPWLDLGGYSRCLFGSTDVKSHPFPTTHQNSPQTNSALLACVSPHAGFYSFCCTGCAGAQGRSNYDGSNCIFNMCCVGLAGNYNVVREGHGIEVRLVS